MKETWETDAFRRRLATIEARLEAIEFDLYHTPPKSVERPAPNSIDVPVTEEG